MLRTYFAIEIEDSPAIIYRDCFLAVQPGAQTTDPRIDGRKESAGEEQELDEVEADCRVP